MGVTRQTILLLYWMAVPAATAPRQVAMCYNMEDQFASLTVIFLGIGPLLYFALAALSSLLHCGKKTRKMRRKSQEKIFFMPQNATLHAPMIPATPKDQCLGAGTSDAHRLPSFAVTPWPFLY